MPRRRELFGTLWLLLIAPLAVAQSPVPLDGGTDEPLLPASIAHLPVLIDGKIAYLAEDEDGTSIAHVIGNAFLRIGEPGRGQELRAEEALIWLNTETADGTPYVRLEIALWKDAEVREWAGTVTFGPVLMVTAATTGPIRIEIDEVSFDRPTFSPLYERGRVLREEMHRDDTPHAMRVQSVTQAGGEEGVPAGPPPVIQFRAQGELHGPFATHGRRVLTVTGGTFLSRGEPGSGTLLEIRADNVVVFLPPSASAPSGDQGPADALGGVPVATREGEMPAAEGGESPGDMGTSPESRTTGWADAPQLATGFGDIDVEAVYLEGDVVMSQGPNLIRASRLYYDFVRDRAMILDAVVRSPIPERGVPIYVRAEEIRQLSFNRFSATHAVLTTDEFHTPHYSIGAGYLELVSRPGFESVGAPGAPGTGEYRIRDATFNVGGLTVGYWPALRGRVDTSETALRSVRTGNSDEFGVELETDWNLFQLLDLETPRGFDAEFSLDFYSERGPAAGIDGTYERDKYMGLFRSYVMTDNQRDFLGREREEQPVRSTRGRILLRHRQYLEDDWQLTLEASYISDKGFLEEFFEDEFDNEKDQETLLYLKKQRDNWAFTILLQARLLDFYTQTERLPEFGYFRIGQPLGDSVVWHSANRLGFVRYRPMDQSFQELLRDGRLVGSGSVVRTDSRQELEAPLDIGPLRLVPFGSIRQTSWDDTPDDGGVQRIFGTYGVRGSMYAWKTYPQLTSALWDIDGLRHVIKTDITAWAAHTNRDSHELYAFDENVEGIDEIDGVQVGVRQRWQTYRGRGETRRKVDVLTLDLETGFFNDATGEYKTNGFTSYSRPEESIARNYVNSNTIWRLNDRTALLSEMNYDVNDAELDILNVSVAVERSPRLRYVIGYRFIDESHSDLLGMDLSYALTDKHSLAVRERFDLRRGRTLDFTVALIRRFPRWFSALSFALDEPEDDFGVNLSIWPEGLPDAIIGSRRLTGLVRPAWVAEP
ncbi:MAG: LPS assembly protein LptD [Phycisphaerae bacterium]|nr:LPS assembly protein LptD [Phycisphaerae bacterium]